MTEKKLEKILVVEDNPTHLADAKAFFEGVEGLEVFYARTFEQAEGFIPRSGESRVDGVITDVFLPIGRTYRGRSRDEDPIGLLVAAECHMQGIPFVFCTAGYHHGLKYNWINMMQRTMQWPEMIDAARDDTEAEHKNWERAYEALKQTLEDNQ